MGSSCRKTDVRCIRLCCVASGEEAVLSGGLDISSLPFSVYAGEILVAPLPAGACITSNCLNELFVNGRRAVRARYPNGNPETQGLWTVNNTGYVPPPPLGSWVAPVPPATPPI